MRSSSRPPAVERARALLGTLVRIRAEHASPGVPEAAIAAAFAEVAEVHRLMSFHEAASDVSRLNRAAAGETVVVDPYTSEVLAFALDMAARSGGLFDPTVGRRAVAAGALPRPDGASDPDPEASWRDVVLEGCVVRLARPLWIDLGGVAKGYAVDRAALRLRESGVPAGCVNAGGDLFVFGPDAALVGLRAAGSDLAPVVEISDGALASSGGDPTVSTVHWDAARGRAVDAARFACVTARTCMAADALTKVVLAAGLSAADPILTAHAASAHTFHPAAGWRSWEAGE